MRILGIVGSAREGGNTETLMGELLKTVEAHGVETEMIRLAEKTVSPCTACETCRISKNRCSVEDDFGPIFDAMKEADAIALGSPVYFGSASPNLMALLDRAGYVSRHGDDVFTRKIGVPLVVARRAGQNFTLAQITFYFLIMGMIVPGSTYWPVAFGRSRGEVLDDTEGLETIRNLGENTVWLMKRCLGTSE